MPDGVERALDSVRTCIESLERSVWPGVAWRFSNLCTDGSPLQFAFSTRDDKLRYAVEVAGPELPDYARVRAACALVARLGGDVPAERLRGWTALQEEHPLRWGAWAGVTHDGSAPRLKVYVEVPRALRADGAAPIGPAILRSSRLMMLGYDCTRRLEEYYYRQPPMDRAETETFLRFVDGQPGRAAVTAFSELCDLPLRVALDWVNFGYSVGDGEAFAIFARARSLPDRARIRAAFLQRERRGGRCDSVYRQLFGDLPLARLPDHGVVSLIGLDSGDVEMRAEASATAIAAM